MPVRADRWVWASVTLCASALLLVLLTFRDYGVTWDEDVHHWYGALVLAYYESGFTDQRALHWQDLFNYGAAFDATAALTARVSPFGIYPTRHLLNGLAGIAGIAGTCKLAGQIQGPRAGFLAGLLLLAVPNYYGQMFNNPKDIPFAAAMVWALAGICRIVPRLPTPRTADIGWFGLAAGLACGVRVGGFLAVFYLGLAILLHAGWTAVERGDWVRPLGTTIVRGFLPAAILAYLVMLPFWPWAQHGPLSHPLAALGNFSHQAFPWPTLFDGRDVPATDLPWDYLPTFIALALPELTLLLALLSLPAEIVSVLQHQKADRIRTIQIAVLAISILFPVAYAIAIRAVLFDGMRHFIFVLPPLAAAASLLLDAGLSALGDTGWRRAVTVACAVYAAGHLTTMVLLHPDEYVYDTGFIGGVARGQSLFKTDYWANSYAEDVHELARYLRTEYGDGFAARRFTVADCGPPVSAAAFFPENFIFEPDRERADFFIAFTKDGCDHVLAGREIFRVERMGALLSLVLDRRRIGRTP